MPIEESPVDVLMSIHPRHANQILSGAKQVEFRRRSPRRLVNYLIMYATSPVQRVVGFARVKSVVEGSLEALWSQFGTVGGITREEFDSYFIGQEFGSVLVLGDVTSLIEPLCANSAIVDRAAPQSFTYISSRVVNELKQTLAHS
jgi:predicted transcriptional regulator